MWFKDEVIYPRFFRSLLWITAIQSNIILALIFVLKILSWHPLESVFDCIFYLLHWKTVFYLVLLACFVSAFGVQNARLCTVEKHVCASRLERIQRALSLHCLQHLISCIFLGGLTAYCFVCLLNNFKKTASFIDLGFSFESDFEYSFITGHGCYTGLMFSLKYFICNLNHIKFCPSEELKVDTVKRQVPDLFKDAFFSVLKAVHWYYLGIIVFGSPLKILAFPFFFYAGSIVDNLYQVLPNPKLFLSALVSGTLTSFIWNLYIVIFNAFATEPFKFLIKDTGKGNKTTLADALKSDNLGFVKYLAALDLRTLAQYDVDRRKQIYAISKPGGHPHEWNAISKICIKSLQEFCMKMYEYAFSTAAEATAAKTLEMKHRNKGTESSSDLTDYLASKVFYYLQQKPVVAYFINELPNAKLMKLFASSQPVIWMIDALAYLVVFSYTEDQYGVVQQSLPDIIHLLLDLKMAEEKMPMGLIGIRTYVKDPQGRYEHVYQRLLLKTTVHNALCRIVGTFKDDIRGVNLPDDYRRYLERYINQNT